MRCPACGAQTAWPAPGAWLDRAAAPVRREWSGRTAMHSCHLSHTRLAAASTCVCFISVLAWYLQHHRKGHEPVRLPRYVSWSGGFNRAQSILMAPIPSQLRSSGHRAQRAPSEHTIPTPAPTRRQPASVRRPRSFKCIARGVDGLTQRPAPTFKRLRATECAPGSSSLGGQAQCTST